MNGEELRKLLNGVARGIITPEMAQKRVEKAAADERVEAKSVKSALRIALGTLEKSNRI